MRYFIALTDKTWFNFLANRKPDEINFWRPGGKSGFRAISPGAPFLFKLHSPDNYVVGGGFFVRHSNIPLSLAWEAFEEKNGANSHEQLLTAVNRHRKNSASENDPTIGCTILTEPFFLERDEWIPVPSDWSPNVQQGKTYDTTTELGGQLWNQIRHRIWRDNGDVVAESTQDYATEILRRARLGQGAFRILVTEAYSRNCAITGERTLPVLEAAHIRPYAKEGPNVVKNGLLLRSDLHILFDRGYMTVTPDLHVEVSKSIKDRFKNGREYYAFHGRQLRSVPESLPDKPSGEYLDWHNRHVYCG